MSIILWAKLGPLAFQGRPIAHLSVASKTWSSRVTEHNAYYYS
jgi:hypothetical protein